MGTSFNNPTANVPSDAKAITLSDTADQAPYAFRGFMVTAAGAVAVITAGGTTITIPGCNPGVQYALGVSRFLTTGTTATGIIGLV